MKVWVRLNIGMIDVDLLNNGTRHPNLAQMKMSGYCKSEGHRVKFLYKPEDLSCLQDYDVIIVSRVFNFNKDPKEIQELKTEVNPGLLIGFSKNTDEEKINRYYNRCVYSAIRKAEYNRPMTPLLLLGGTGYFEDGGVDLR